MWFALIEVFFGV